MDVLAIQNLKKALLAAKKCFVELIYLCLNTVFSDFIGEKTALEKTTTMKAILGLLKADSGEIYVMGEKGAFWTNQYQ